LISLRELAAAVNLEIPDDDLRAESIEVERVLVRPTRSDVPGEAAGTLILTTCEQLHEDVEKWRQFIKTAESRNVAALAVGVCSREPELSTHAEESVANGPS
jgi:hypothetical protein